jgi:hypothetical protein
LFEFIIVLCCRNFATSHHTISTFTMEPDRKRGHFEFPASGGSNSMEKRPRAEDFNQGGGGMGGGEVYSRMYLNQTLFAKVIGKGGAMIKQIRQQYGAYLKGVDVNEADRMVSG